MNITFILETRGFATQPERLLVPLGKPRRVRISESLGDEGIRTPDLLLARQALSQLSYAPALRGTISGEYSGKLHPQWA